MDQLETLSGQGAKFVFFTIGTILPSFGKGAINKAGESRCTIYLLSRGEREIPEIQGVRDPLLSRKPLVRRIMSQTLFSEWNIILIAWAGIMQTWNWTFPIHPSAKRRARMMTGVLHVPM